MTGGITAQVGLREQDTGRTGGCRGAGTRTLLLLHVQCGQSQEPGPRPLWNASPSPVPCFSTVCLSALSQGSSHTDLWLLSSVSPAPSSCCQVSIKHTLAPCICWRCPLPEMCKASAKPLHTKQWLLSPSALVSGFQKGSCCCHVHQLSPDSNEEPHPAVLLLLLPAQAQLPWSCTAARTDF